MTKDIFFKTEILGQYLSGKITAAKVAKILDLSLRQARRIIKKYKEKGKMGLFHGLKNKTSNHNVSKETKEKILELIKNKYYNFNPTLANKCLFEHDGLSVKPNTLGIWMRKEHLQSKLRKRTNGRRRQSPTEQREKERNALGICPK
ncbi:MAG: helix-turn-helix domain-containing protein [Rickettsiales bacterium]|jgi:transposase|nr:helix-turn-helix domain-containing protein [Rickettsiales bacterium]